jgi:hypothetical protein
MGGGGGHRVMFSHFVQHTAVTSDRDALGRVAVATDHRLSIPFVHSHSRPAGHISRLQPNVQEERCSGSEGPAGSYTFISSSSSFCGILTQKSTTPHPHHSIWVSIFWKKKPASWPSGNVIGSRYEGSRFEYWPGHLLSCMRNRMAFLSPSRQIPGYLD